MLKDESILKYEIKGSPSFAHVAITLDKPGQDIIAEGGAMIYMDGHIQMTTKSSGGIMKGLKRTLSGESMFQNYFSLPEGSNQGTVVFSHGVPGDIIHLHLKQGEKWVLSRDGYICSTMGIAISTKASGKQFFGGEGLFQTTVTAEKEGDIWLGGYGMVEKHEIKQDQEFLVDTSIMMAYSANIQHKVSKVGGKKSFILGGEGFVIRYTGPGIVYTQNRDIRALASLIWPFLPKSR
ncbi:MAG: TIGR00266 family protein [Candidatus Lokiarchaeota archaeon]|nr:TIGR00266 family protein [Candidatus Lokiarchaeota archaeon]